MTRRRIPMEAALVRRTSPGSVVSRVVSPSDKEALAILLFAAYRGTIDDEGDSFADALVEIEKTFRGDYGRFLSECSFAVEEGEFLASACLVTFFDPHGAPLVVFLMTRPEAKRRGLARHVLERSMNALLEAGYERLTLVVTDGNEPAQSLYRRLGFAPIEGPLA
ncbi:MAG: GNAT family N-acetyltransferase [Candidatus Bipolaricaulis sp.]|nr:GNAT family N-acetyltransferase [Candidatus Bipolaricaulis sp.]